MNFGPPYWDVPKTKNTVDARLAVLRSIDRRLEHLSIEIARIRLTIKALSQEEGGHAGRAAVTLDPFMPPIV